MIVQLLDYSVGMTPFDSLTRYLNNRYHFIHCIQMEKPALKLKIANEVMYLCCKKFYFRKVEIALRLYLTKGFSTYSIEVSLIEG